MLNFSFRKSRSSLPPCVRTSGIAIVDLDACMVRFPLNERKVAEELTDYLHWKYSVDLVFDPLYAGMRQIRDASGPRALREAQQILGYWEARTVPWAAPRPSVLDLIRSLAAEGIMVAVATEKMQYTATKLLTSFGISGRVDMVIGGNDVRQPRPDPEPLFAILKATGFRSHEAVYIGTRRSDFEIGRRAGIPTYAYNYVLDTGAALPSHQALTARRTLTATS